MKKTNFHKNNKLEKLNVTFVTNSILPIVNFVFMREFTTIKINFIFQLLQRLKALGLAKIVTDLLILIIVSACTDVFTKDKLPRPKVLSFNLNQQVLSIVSPANVTLQASLLYLNMSAGDTKVSIQLQKKTKLPSRNKERKPSLIFNASIVKRVLRITMLTVSTRDTRILNLRISNVNLLHMEYLMKIYSALIARESL